MSVIAVLSVKMVTANMLLSVFFLSGALAVCPQDSALFITAPQKMEALSGSCLQIPCNFRAGAEKELNSTRSAFGVWIKNDTRLWIFKSNVIFNSSGTVNTYPMNITGNLSQKNCTTLFSNLLTSYTDKYFFRIENWPFRATATCDPLQITVKDSPPSPRIEISGDLKEKESVTITCSASTPCPHSPPKLTWSLQQDSHSYTEENTDGTFTTKIQATITLSDQHDGDNITCSARYPVNEGEDVKTAEERKTLSVSYTSGSISPSGLVSAGSWVNLTCSSRAKPPVSRFTWFKKSTDGPMTVSEGQVYSFNATDGGVYYCVATNDLGKQTSSEIHLTIEDSPKDAMVVISPTDPVSVGSVVNLTCSCRGNPPVVHFVWFMISDGRLELIRVDTQVYGFEVTSSDRGRLYYCGCRNDLDIQLSTGRQLIFEGDQQSELVGVQVIVKTLGILTLVSTLVIFECWFRSRRSTKPAKNTVEADYVNSNMSS